MPDDTLSGPDGSPVRLDRKMIPQRPTGLTSVAFPDMVLAPSWPALFLLLDQPQLQALADRLGAVGCFQLFQDVAHMGLDRVLGNE